jgi:hypothetical protein
VPLNLLLKCSLRIRPGNDVDVSSFSLAESPKAFRFLICFHAREAEPDIAISHETRSRSPALEAAPNGHLAGKQKRPGISALATELERAEILVPRSFWHIGLRFHPEAELIQILEADIALMHALDQVIPKSGGKFGPGLDLRHSFTRQHSPASLTEDESPHLVAQLLYLIGIRRRAKAFRQREESFLFFLLRGEALLDQFDQHAIIAQASFFCDTLHLLSQP